MNGSVYPIPYSNLNEEIKAMPQRRRVSLPADQDNSIAQEKIVSSRPDLEVGWMAFRRCLSLRK